MHKIGQYHPFRIIKEVPFGVYLDGGDLGEILLPNKVVPKNARIGDQVEAFIYFDSEDKLIATTLRAKAAVNECAFLKVIDVNRVGAFLDWGLDKDLLAPRSEQRRPMELNRSYLVYLKQDDLGRIIASSKLDYFLDKSPIDFKQGQAVSLLIAETTELGHKVIINHRHWGLIHQSDVFQALRYGQAIQGYIKTIREDGKIDVTLRKAGQDRIDELANQILLKLQEANGFLPLHDKSASSDIMFAFNESKASFKNAIGRLYKQGKIHIEPNGIRLQHNHGL